MPDNITRAEDTYQAVDNQREAGRAVNHTGFPGKFLLILDYIFVLRPMILIPVWIFLLLGYHFGSQAAGTNYSRWFPSAGLAGTFLIFTGLAGGIYIMNQIADRISDARNRKCFFITDGIIPLRVAWIYISLLFLVALAGSTFFNWQYRVLMLISILLGYMYNMRPFHFKGRAFWDVAANAIGVGLLSFGIGWTAVTALSSGEGMHIRAIAYTLAVAGVSANTIVADMEGDQSAGEKTTALLIGRKKCGALALFLMIASVAAAFAVSDWHCFAASGLSLPLFVVALISDRVKWYMTSYKLATLIFALVTALLFFWFAPLVFICIGLTKWYYSKRFNLRYPF
jgi:4-hydroxybenzoate polyprenyltransferase